MKILNLKDFLSEKMKIIPISNDELDNVQEYDPSEIIMHEIKNPSYEDILVPGNVVYTSERSCENIYICWGKYNYEKSKNIINFVFANNKYVMICCSYDDTHRYINCSAYQYSFPKNNNDIIFNILSVYKTNIDISKIKTRKELDKIKSM